MTMMIFTQGIGKEGGVMGDKTLGERVIDLEQRLERIMEDIAGLPAERILKRSKRRKKPLLEATICNVVMENSQICGKVCRGTLGLASHKRLGHGIKPRGAGSGVQGEAQDFFLGALPLAVEGDREASGKDNNGGNRIE